MTSPTTVAVLVLASALSLSGCLGRPALSADAEGVTASPAPPRSSCVSAGHLVGRGRVKDFDREAAIEDALVELRNKAAAEA